MYSVISCIWVQMLNLWRVRFTLLVFTERLWEMRKDCHVSLTSLCSSLRGALQICCPLQTRMRLDIWMWLSYRNWKEVQWIKKKRDGSSRTSQRLKNVCCECEASKARYEVPVKAAQTHRTRLPCSIQGDCSWNFDKRLFTPSHIREVRH